MMKGGGGMFSRKTIVSDEMIFAATILLMLVPSCFSLLKVDFGRGLISPYI